MVDVNSEVGPELAALIRSQEEDARRHRVRHRGRLINGVDLDRLAAPARYDAIVPIEGRSHEWGLPVTPTCPTCKGQCGNQPCLRCDGGAWGRPLRGRVNPDVPVGPTSYTPDGALKGGVGR